MASKSTHDYSIDKLRTKKAPSTASSVTAVEYWHRAAEGLEPKQAQYKSYREYILKYTLFLPELRWMKSFFEDGPPQRQCDTSVTIWDSLGYTTSETHLSPSELPHLNAIIATRPPEVKCRIFLVHYDTVRTVDRDVVDMLGQAYDIDPLFFRHHFFSNTSSKVRNSTDGSSSAWETERMPPRTLPSELHHSARTIELPYDEDWHISVQQFSDSKPDSINHDTIIIWCRFKKTVDRLALRAEASGKERPSMRYTPCEPHLSKHVLLPHRYTAGLSWFTPEQRSEADAKPLSYLYPLMRILLLEKYTEYDEIFNPDRQHNHDDMLSWPKMKWRQRMVHIRRQYRVLGRWYREMRNILSVQQPHKPFTIEADFHGLLGDTEHLITEYQEAEEFYRRLKTEDLQTEQLKEAVESKNATISVGMLTRLAFIFIPLNFTTSFFGMNMARFGSGNLPLWVFFALAGSIGALTLIPVAGSIWDSLEEWYEERKARAGLATDAY